MKPTDTLITHFRIDAPHQKALARLNIETIGDLLNHIPQRYEDINQIRAIDGLQKGEDVVVYGKIGGLKSRKAWKSRRPIAEGWVEDSSGRMPIMWFNQPYIAKMLADGMYVKVAGTVTGSEGKLYIANPETETLDALPIERTDSIFQNTDEETLFPIYRETRGISSKWFYHHAKKCFEAGVLTHIKDPIPEDILARYTLPTLKTAYQWVHTPKKAEHAQSARKRFAFEEVFYIQVQKAKERAEADTGDVYHFATDDAHIAKFTERFPFTLTDAQDAAITALLADFQKDRPMSRLLEGDVGSGKTAVAATTAYAVATSTAYVSNRAARLTANQTSEGIIKDEDSSRRGESSEKAVENTYGDRGTEAPQRRNNPSLIMPERFGNLQVAYMAPTEILAKQHFHSFIEYFHHLPIQIGLITGSGCMKFPSKVDPTKPTSISKAQLLKWIKSGEIPIVIGTHSLIYKSVAFKHLAYVIIDEQHRFGTGQRRALAKKDAAGGVYIPHLLSMTATPIPRTLALTLYGDLDITLLDSMPKGRKPVQTTLVTKGKEADMYTHVENELESGRQAYVICPRIDEPDEKKANAIRAKSVTEEAKRLQKRFPNATIDILHSKMSPKKKEEVMQQFDAHEIDILVATSVVEVGINVPNATNIIIEGAERFGLAQLHQLRGRVMRGEHQPYCFLVTESTAQKTKERLKALTTAKSGFELAEYDLAFRGTGELYGKKQSGLSDLGMEAIKNLKLVEAAREEAQKLIEQDPALTTHLAIATRVAKLGETLHME